ncbi:hypothetical protein PsorP6_011873 [Peronosclerospora sorghi]|uniref:Uncharacterized protein n=1 Tax=Peronosclerospora sorghi TaxID=230839 RepID=A0ACC0WJZ9_9STRA|nr:hypothetical protein PsorP6_011873 [Peronosclerospora sorghi]
MNQHESIQCEDNKLPLHMPIFDANLDSVSKAPQSQREIYNPWQTSRHRALCLVVKGARGIGETQASESGSFFLPFVLIERLVSDCQVQCGDVVLRTASIAKTTTPTWCQNFTFGIKKPLGDVVRFKVFGLREHGRDVLLGISSLLMETLTPDTLTAHEQALVDANDFFMASTLERDADTSKKESMALSAPGSPKTSEELSPLLMEKESAGMEPPPKTQVSSVIAQDALQATK